MDSSFIIHRVLIICCFVQLVLGADKAYQQVSLDLQNHHRQKHHAKPLLASVDLNKRAVRCAKYYAEKGRIDHSCPHKNGTGENLWVQWGGSVSDSDAAKSSSESWYSEGKGYNYKSNAFQGGKGHFTQMVWKNSTEFGFGTARKGNMIVGCGLYSPPGNMIGQFKTNVGKP